MNKKGRSPLHGIICMWSGNRDDIPDGWALCNGTNGTPDLSTKFIRSANAWLYAHTSGGVNSHVHTGSAQSASDNLAAGNEITGTYPDGDIQTTTSGHTHTLSINSALNIPSWYALCFIMKL